MAIRDEASTTIYANQWGRTRAEGDASGIFLNTYTSPADSATQVFHTALDLGLPWPVMPGDPFIHNPEYAGWVDTDTMSSKGLLAAVAGFFHISSIYAAANERGDLLVSGIKGTDQPSFQNWVYGLAGPGPCQQPPPPGGGTPCIFQRAVVSTLDDVGRPVVTTSLAAPGPNSPYSAVGLSDGTVRILNENLRTVGIFTVPSGSCCQAPVTALAWDPSGSGKLAVGAMTKGSAGFVITVNSDGSVAPSYATWDQVGTDSLVTVPLSVAWGLDANKNPVVGYGVNNARLMLVNPSSGTTTATYTYANVTGAATNVTAVPRVDGTSGGDDWAVTVQPGTDITTADGTLIRFTGTTGAEQVLRPASGSDDGTLLKSLDDFRSWFPGWKLSSAAFGANNTGEPLDVSLYARPESGYGCWFSPQLPKDPQTPPENPPLVQFPTDVTLPAGGLDENFVVGALTSGSQGKCNAGDETSTRRGYVVLTPESSQQTASGPASTRPDDALIVNLTMNSNPLSYDLSDTSGGPISLSTTTSVPSDYPIGPYGQLVMTVNEPAQPSPVAAPTIVKAVQLNNPVGAEPQARVPHRRRADVMEGSRRRRGSAAGPVPAAAGPGHRRPAGRRPREGLDHRRAVHAGGHAEPVRHGGRRELGGHLRERGHHQSERLLLLGERQRAGLHPAAGNRRGAGLLAHHPGSTTQPGDTDRGPGQYQRQAGEDQRHHGVRRSERGRPGATAGPGQRQWGRCSRPATRPTGWCTTATAAAT